MRAISGCVLLVGVYCWWVRTVSVCVLLVGVYCLWVRTVNVCVLLVGAYCWLVRKCVRTVGLSILILCVYYYCVISTYYWCLSYWCRCVKVNGITYKPNCSVVCGVIDEEPTLAKVRDIYIMDCNRVVFEIQRPNNKGFNKHYHVFIVEAMY